MQKHNLYSALAGYSLIGAASGLFVYGGLGADCFNTLVKGIAPFWGLPAGTSSYLIQMTMLAAVLLLGGRKYAGPGTILGSFLVTVIVNLFGVIFAPALAAAPLAVKAAFALAAAPVAGLGLALITRSGLGSTANDILPILLSERLPRLQFRTVRIIYDCVELLTGFALGIRPGFATLCAALLIGPCIQASTRLLDHPIRYRRRFRRAR